MTEHTTKRVAPPKLQKQPSSMPPPRPIHPKEREVYELSNDEDFLSSHNAKACIISHLSYILFFGYKYWHIFFLTLELSRVCCKQANNKKNVFAKQTLEHVKPSKPYIKQNITIPLVIIPI